MDDLITRARADVAAMNDAGWTLRRIAEESGTNRKTVQNLRRAIQKRINPDVADKIAELRARLTADGEMLAKGPAELRCLHCTRLVWRKGTPPERRPEGSVLLSARGACASCYHRIYTVGGADRPQRTTEPKAKPAAPPVLSNRTGHEPWRDEAVCREIDPELFFPNGTTGPAVAQIDEAKAVCATCPAMLLCRDWARETRQSDGVWGGEHEDERKAWLRQEARSAARERVAA